MDTVTRVAVLWAGRGCVVYVTTRGVVIDHDREERVGHSHPISQVTDIWRVGGGRASENYPLLDIVWQLESLSSMAWWSYLPRTLDT